MKMITNGYQFEDYQRALEGAGPKLKELILERAAHDHSIDFKGERRAIKTPRPVVAHRLSVIAKKEGIS